MTNDQPTVLPDIVHGNAIVVGTEDGWILPGGKRIRDQRIAFMYARRMARMMTKLEVVK